MSHLSRYGPPLSECLDIPAHLDYTDAHRALKQIVPPGTKRGMVPIEVALVTEQ
ncbi:MAG: hypothetical protein MUP64_03845 [Anaerolineae bacterium]|nr:hypothetical protein [Anaerolineae bacterium]